MSKIPIVDLIFLVLIILTVLRVHYLGFLREFFSWAKMVLAIAAAVFLHPVGARFIRSKVMENVQYIPELFSFIVIFMVVVLFLKMLEHILKDMVTGAKLGGADKLLGAVLGAVEGFVLVALIIFVLSIQTFFDSSSILNNSIFAQIILPLIKSSFARNPALPNVALFVLPHCTAKLPLAVLLSV